MEIRRYRLGEEDEVWSVIFAATRKSIARDYHPDLIERWAPHDSDVKEWLDRLAKKNPLVALLTSR